MGVKCTGDIEITHEHQRRGAIFSPKAQDVAATAEAATLDLTVVDALERPETPSRQRVEQRGRAVSGAETPAPTKGTRC